MADFSLDVVVKKEGKWYVVSDKKFGLATQGKTSKEAILNFYEAFEMCYRDSDWRELHNITSPEAEKNTVENAPSQVDLVVKISTSFWQTITPYLLQPI